MPVIPPSQPINIKADQNQGRSSPPIIVQEAGGSSQASEVHPLVFTFHPYIPIEDRLVTVEDTTLGDGGVAFALAHSVILPRDMESLEGIETPTLGILSFQCLVVVIISLSFDLYKSFTFFN